MAYTTIDDPTAYFQTKTYTGDGTTSNAQTFDGNTNMQPDMVWFKRRSGAANHFLYDSVRGANRSLVPNDTDAEATSGEQTTYLASFDSNGFTLGDDVNNVNASGETYVLWGWNTGTAFTNDASATGIGSIDSSGSFNNDSGFSIVSYTGTESAGTIKHGLSSVPKMIIAKDRDSGSLSWFVGHASLGFTKRLKLDGTNAAEDNTVWNNTNPTSSVFSVGSSANANTSGNAIIAYCFAEKQGYSKFGSYTGNGNADGPFVYTGFKPSFVMVKRSTTAGENWLILDNKRDTFNPQDSSIYPNLANAEDADGADYFDFISNGMKVRTTNGGTNTSGATYIYMAFAENPFVSSTGVPACAR